MDDEERIELDKAPTPLYPRTPSTKSNKSLRGSISRSKAERNRFLKGLAIAVVLSLTIDLIILGIIIWRT